MREERGYVFDLQNNREIENDIVPISMPTSMWPTNIYIYQILSIVPLRIQVCPKEGIIHKISEDEIETMIFRLHREGYGFLGYRYL